RHNDPVVGYSAPREEGQVRGVGSTACFTAMLISSCVRPSVSGSCRPCRSREVCPCGQRFRVRAAPRGGGPRLRPQGTYPRKKAWIVTSWPLSFVDEHGPVA